MQTLSPALRCAVVVVLLFLLGCGTGTRHERTQDALDRIHEAVLEGNDAYAKLTELCDDIGHRLSGSPQLDRAIDWAVARLKADGHENVRAERVMVPRWIRGRESLAMVEPREHPMPMLGLGGSVATSADGITAEVVVVRDKAELDKLPTAEGKIVLFNYAMPPYDPEKGPRYGETVAYRANGAAWAAEKGAVAALVRSVTAKSLRTPHTGGMRYADGKPKIPAASVTIEDADLMARLVARGKKVVVKLMMEAKTEADAPSANVVAELRGREKPDEVVVISGHLDTWDVGQGAQDDAGGCVMAMEALRTLRRLNLVPRRTVRVVLWTNEENGMAGVRGYLDQHAWELPLHAAAIESDSGTFELEGFGIDLQDPERLKAAAALLKERLPKYDLKTGESAPDVGHFKARGVPCIGLRVDRSTYFDYHHTPADTVDKVDPKILSKCTAAMAALAYAIAEMPGRLDAPPDLVAGRVDRIATGFSFTEGPAAAKDGSVWFTDIPNNRIVKWDGTSASTAREKSGAANGLMFDAKGRLVACEGGNRRVTRIDGDTVDVLADAFGGKKLNSPNDLDIDAKGGIYFTDPRYGKRDDLEQDKEAVYYIAPEGGVRRVADSLQRPNGVLLSNDGSTLYVADEAGGKLVAFEVKEDASLGAPKDFAAGRFDGLAIDERGNVYAAGRGGVWVFDGTGRHVWTIATPENPTNCAFTGTHLYITAQKSLYRVGMKVKGR